MSDQADRLDATLGRLRRMLLERRVDGSHWRGRLSSSALSTATAVLALRAVKGPGHDQLLRRGMDWLAANANADGGWGDTDRSASNLSTTLLALAALEPSKGTDHGNAAACARAWVLSRTGSLRGPQVAQAVIASYGADKTFSAPILAACAAGGLLGPSPDCWRLVPPLPLELGIFSHRLLRWMSLPVVSYALPALIAVGQARLHFAPPRGPVRWLRRLALGRALRRLQTLQPSSGGYLEAAPLTSFVAMLLAATGRGDHPAATRGAEFLRRTVRSDGSWPIDTDLAGWLTSLSVAALSAGGELGDMLTSDQRDATAAWLLAAQHKGRHPYTGAAGGGWGWTDLGGSVTDADDTAGALVALECLGQDCSVHAAVQGVRWLADLQNRDGGLPTFCRGWGKLPFDRSSADLTAHALLAWGKWRPRLPGPMARRVLKCERRAVAYLLADQHKGGSWQALWFGSEHAPDLSNKVYGTARVLLGLARVRGPSGSQGVARAVEAGCDFLLRAQNTDGSWGAGPALPPSVEETALAVDALAKVLLCQGSAPDASALAGAVRRGTAWLLDAWSAAGPEPSAAPIGLYFARLWYYEELYPLIFSVYALSRASRALADYSVSS